MKKKNFLLIHINNNLRSYILITIIFLCGIVLGVLFINNVNQTQEEEIKEYIENFTSIVQEDITINYMNILFYSLKKNLFLILVLWFAGLTVIGVFAVYGMIGYKGFCLGYSVSSVIAVLGTKNRNNICFVVYAIAKYYTYSGTFLHFHKSV